MLVGARTARGGALLAWFQNFTKAGQAADQAFPSRRKPARREPDVRRIIARLRQTSGAAFVLRVVQTADAELEHRLAFLVNGNL
jgi:hypothetical protein